MRLNIRYNFLLKYHISNWKLSNHVKIISSFRYLFYTKKINLNTNLYCQKLIFNLIKTLQNEYKHTNFLRT